MCPAFQPAVASPSRAFRLLAVLLLLGLPAASQESRNAADQNPTPLPDTAVQQPYSHQLPPPAGAPPWTWRLVSGALPPGLALSPQGTLTGVPSAVGTYRVQVRATDSATPPHTISYHLELVVHPLLEVNWDQPPAVETDRIQGGIKVVNYTYVSLDLTVIVVAINEIGKAFALGYQHFDFAPGTQIIPFGSSLPRGTYLVHADAIGEIANPKAILHGQLQTPRPLVVP
jgi:Putative Ig domain